VSEGRHNSAGYVDDNHVGQPAECRSMATWLGDHGLPLRTARISALRQVKARMAFSALTRSALENR
jgi:hypothetical protein